MYRDVMEENYNNEVENKATNKILSDISTGINLLSRELSFYWLYTHTR